jgi:hypothetical protein
MAQQPKQTLQVFTFRKGSIAGVVTGYGRGHAVSLVSKELKARGLTLEKTDPVEPVDLDSKKGQVIVFALDSSGKENADGVLGGAVRGVPSPEPKAGR